MATLIKDLFDLPNKVQGGEFVLRLADGLQQPDETLKTCVVKWGKLGGGWDAARFERTLTAAPQSED